MASSVIALAPALFALRGGELAAYHGVEHKAIAAYETDADAADAAKEHDRCGSHLMAPLLSLNLAGGGGVLGQFGRSRARRVEPSSQTVTFADVAGIEEAKQELLEVGRAALAEILRVEAPATG
jgi:hypothetical protein